MDISGGDAVKMRSPDPRPSVWTQFSWEMWYHGSSFTYNEETGASYLHIYPSPDLFGVGETGEVVPGSLMVDLDKRGRLRGIEKIGASPLDISDLLLVLRWMNERPKKRGKR